MRVADQADITAELHDCIFMLRLAVHSLSGGFPSGAAGDAFRAAERAARTFVLVRGGRVVKTHSGIQSEFWRLTEAEPHLRRSHGVLATGLALRFKHDYGSPQEVSHAEAVRTLCGAAALVRAVAQVLNVDVDQAPEAAALWIGISELSIT